MTEIQVLGETFRKMTGMDEQAFALSHPYWQLKAYKKGEFYNEYKNVCKHLGFVISGIFRTYYVHEATGEEKNMLFYTENQIVSALKSFLTQKPCNYYTECVVDSTI